jgi:phosphate-selective porin OprO/OprP
VDGVSELRLGDKIFTSGFSDPNLWSNSAVTTELGMNWYCNEHFKIYMFWLHGEFGEPVMFRPGGLKVRRHFLAEVQSGHPDDSLSSCCAAG